MTKETDRERIAREVAAFISGGGKIDVVESKPVYPNHMKWIGELGMDYSTWDEIGGEEWYSRDGSYRLDPEDFEEF